MSPTAVYLTLGISAVADLVGIGALVWWIGSRKRVAADRPDHRHGRTEPCAGHRLVRALPAAGGCPKKREYSRLNWDALSYPTSNATCETGRDGTGKPSTTSSTTPGEASPPRSRTASPRSCASFWS